MTTTTTLTPAAETGDRAIKLSEATNYYVITVDWEYDTHRYIVTHYSDDAIKADFTEMVLAWPRDEGFVITDVRRI
jgi:hypothetical protein